MSLIDYWIKVGAVCGALITICTAIVLAYRKVVRPMWRHTMRSIRRINRGADDLLGKPAEYDADGTLISPKITSLREEIVGLNSVVEKLRAEMLSLRGDFESHYHPKTGGQPVAGKPPWRGNGGPRAVP